MWGIPPVSAAMRRSLEPTACTRWAAPLSPIAAAPPAGNVQGDNRPLFEAQGLEYSVEYRDGRVLHQETRRDSAGRVITRNEAEVRFVVGSGRQAFAYLIEHDGFLFQSPLTWYAQKRRWDLSPGYEKSNLHFHRPVTPSCLFCHANRVEPVSGTVNRYRPPILRATPSAASGATGPVSSISRFLLGRREGHDHRQPREPGALAPGCGLRAMPLERSSARFTSRPSG